MPKVFLSPAQHAKPCLNYPKCDERQECNRMCDAMIPYLDASGIQLMRNDWAEERPSEIVKKSNAFKPDFHFTFHTNGGGGNRGTIYYCDGSTAGKRMAELVVKHLKTIYPRTLKIATERWTELTDTKAPAVYAEPAFHDGNLDSPWIHENEAAIGKCYTMAVCEYFGVAFVEPGSEPSPQPEPAPKPDAELEKYARVVAAEARGECYDGQLAVTLCIFDRLNDPAKRFGKTTEAVLEQFAAPWQGDLSTTTCMQAVQDVFVNGKRYFEQKCLWVLGVKARQETIDDRNAKYVFLGQIDGQKFWGDVKSSVVRPEIKKGSTGNDVRDAQILLTNAGYSVGSNGADGKFGTNTDTATRAFQRANGLKVDGWIGEKTWEALDKAVAPTPSPQTYTVKAGDKLGEIAKAHGTTVFALSSLNGIVDPNIIHPGQVLKLS